MILIVLPVLVVLLLRLHRQYESGGRSSSSTRCPPPPPRRSCGGTWCSCSSTGSTPPPPAAIQYARSLTPDELRAVHFVIDDAHAAELAEQWRQLGLQRVPLELVACSDRRLTRAAVECVARRAVRPADRGVGAPPRAEVQGRLAPRPPRPHR